MKLRRWVKAALLSSAAMLTFVLLGGISKTSTHSGPAFAGTFKSNQGQLPSAIRFVTRGDGYDLFLTEREAVLTLSPASGRQRVLRMSLEGSRAPEAIEGLDPSGSAFGAVQFRGVYRGVDLVLAEGRLKPDFVLTAGATAADIRIRFDGMEQMAVDSTGALTLHMGPKMVSIPPPVVYQETGNQRLHLRYAYRILEGNRVGLRLGSTD